MATNNEDPDAERLAAEVAALTSESKGAAVRRFLADEIWPHIPPEVRDRPPTTKSEREEILGYGSEGV